MITAEELLEAFERNWGIIQAQTKGLSHEQCLLQPPFRGNCMNWVLGHIADTRNDLLKALNEEPLMNPEESARYGYESEPVCADGQDVFPLERLLGMIRQSQERIGVVLPRMSAADFQRLVQGHRREITLGNRLFDLYFHETYHMGQTELLRQLAGTDDKVI